MSELNGSDESSESNQLMNRLEMKELKDGVFLQPSDMKRSETRLFFDAFRMVTYTHGWDG